MSVHRPCFCFLDKPRTRLLSHLCGNAANVWNGIIFSSLDWENNDGKIIKQTEKGRKKTGNRDYPSLCFCRHLHPFLRISYLYRIKTLLLWLYSHMLSKCVLLSHCGWITQRKKSLYKGRGTNYLTSLSLKL